VQLVAQQIFLLPVPLPIQSPIAQSLAKEQVWPLVFLQCVPEHAYPLAPSQLLFELHVVAQTPALHRYSAVQGTGAGGVQPPLPSQVPAATLER
jgi:hypothetical protein